MRARVEHVISVDRAAVINRPPLGVARVPLDAEAAAALPEVWRTTVTATGADGEALPHELRHAVLEDWRGAPVLHLQANAPRRGIEREAVTAVFALRAR